MRARAFVPPLGDGNAASEALHQPRIHFSPGVLDREIRERPRSAANGDAGVREAREQHSGTLAPRDIGAGLAHPSISFPLYLNANWRVVDHPLQWIVQRRQGKPRDKNSGWCARLFFTTRGGLLSRLREYCGEVHPQALVKLEALPERHR